MEKQKPTGLRSVPDLDPVDLVARLDNAADVVVLLTGDPITGNPLRAIRDHVRTLLGDVQLIQRRTFAHADDTDADRRRHLYHAGGIATRILDRYAPAGIAASAASDRSQLELDAMLGRAIREASERGALTGSLAIHYGEEYVAVDNEFDPAEVIDLLNRNA